MIEPLKPPVPEPTSPFVVGVLAGAMVLLGLWGLWRGIVWVGDTALCVPIVDVPVDGAHLVKTVDGGFLAVSPKNFESVAVCAEIGENGGACLDGLSGDDAFRVTQAIRDMDRSTAMSIHEYAMNRICFPARRD